MTEEVVGSGSGLRKGLVLDEGVLVSLIGSLFLVAIAAHSASKGSSRIDLLTSACHRSLVAELPEFVELGLL